MPETIFSKACFRLVSRKKGQKHSAAKGTEDNSRVNAFPVKLVVKWRDGQDVSLKDQSNQAL
jgi:hypothetical protein